MNLSVDDMTLVAAARSGERGALRALAVSLDGRLGEEEACLDGAVMAWRAVKGPGRPFGGTMAAVSKHLVSLGRWAGDRISPGPVPHVAPVSQAEVAPALHRRPAA
jgi:hypothetical protein